MTRWGLILLVTYFVLGLSGLEARLAMRYAVWTTMVVLAAVALTMGVL